MVDPPDRRRRDEGSILLLVIVLIVIVALIVAPMMRYALSVHRASAAQAVKSRDVEAAKGGVRRVLGDPAALFDVCQSSLNNLGGPSMDRAVATTCQVVGTRHVKQSADVPYSLASVQVDSVTPTGYASNTYTNQNTVGDYAGWLASVYSTASTAGMVWVPDLPVRTTSPRLSTPVAMQAGAQNPGYASCEVFFPGTYSDAVIVNSPVYFLSGVYYFEDDVSFVGGADALIGDGTLEGCTSDLDAVSYATTVPTTINGSGFGATFVLGDDARLIVDNSGAGEVRVRFNQRYVGPDELGVAASAGVSIASVNGDQVSPGSALDLTGVIKVPHSQVGGPSPEPAVDAGYLPSLHNSRPEPMPANPTNLTTFQTGYGTGGVTVEWDDPNLAFATDASGVRVTGYLVTSSPASPSGVCAASIGQTGDIERSCTFADLTLDQPGGYTFTVETLYDAAPIAGQSLDLVVSAASAPATPTATDPLVADPRIPTGVGVGAIYDTGVEIGWVAPVSDGGAPIAGYTVTATPSGAVSTTTVECQGGWDAMNCVLVGLAGTENYAVEVIADNRILPLLPPVGGTTSFVFAPSLIPAPTVTAAAMPVRMPDPIIDIDLTGPGKATIEVLGYVSVPQGHIRIEAALGDPSNSTVELSGGAVAAMFRPIDGAGVLTNVPSTFELELTNPITQKIIRIVSTTDRMTATALVQVNATGSWALNSMNVQ